LRLNNLGAFLHRENEMLKGLLAATMKPRERHIGWRDTDVVRVVNRVFGGEYGSTQAMAGTDVLPHWFNYVIVGGSYYGVDFLAGENRNTLCLFRPGGMYPDARIREPGEIPEDVPGTSDLLWGCVLLTRSDTI
jgi:hypothetical protein